MKKEESNELTKALIERAYSCACAHGFHEEDLSGAHYLMLVLSEIGEAVEADRKGRYVDLSELSPQTFHPDNIHFKEMFESVVKDSVFDELADVCIRLYDMCGALGIEPRVEYEGLGADFVNIFGADTFCERMYYLSRLLCSTNGVVEDDGTDECLPRVIGSALSFLFALSKDMMVGLMQSIELKMKYNESRPMLNGKKY